MPRELALATRRDRNAALVEAMLLAAIADGDVSQLELQSMLRRVMERPEFEGTRPDELNALVESSLKRLSEAQDLDQVMKSLRDRLPDHRNRMLAFGLAAAVAFADKRASRAELGLLKHIQAALGISEEEVMKIVDVVEHGASLSEALGEPPERLYAEVMVLAAAADGKLEDAEAQALVESFATDPAFQAVDAKTAQAYVADAVGALALDGLPKRIRVLAAGLATHRQRLQAFRLAVRVVKSTGHASRPEQRILQLLQATFGLADDEVARIAAET